MTRSYTVLKPDLAERRDSRNLLIWRDVPHWMVVDDEAMAVIRLSGQGCDLNKLADSIAETRGTTREQVLSDVNGLMSQLEHVGIAYRKRPKRMPLSRRPVLENVTINVTHRCNLRCSHCFFDPAMDVSGQFKVRDLEKFLKQGSRYIHKNVNFVMLGGEPLLEMEKTLAIAEVTLAWGGNTAVSTNGTLVDADFAERARELGLMVQVSVDGSCPEVNDAIRGKGSFVKAINGVQILVEAGTHTTINMVVQQSNIHDIEEFYDLSKRLGTDEVRFIGLNMMGRARTGGIEPVPKIEVVQALHDLIRSRPDAGKRMRRDYFTILKTTCSTSNRRYYCGTGLKTMLIDSDGEVYPCPNHRHPEFRCGRISDRSFQDIWVRSPLLTEIRAIYDLEENNKECEQCPIKHWCMGGCRGETYENTHNLRGPSIRCQENRSVITEMMWLLASDGEITQDSDRIEYF